MYELRGRVRVLPKMHEKSAIFVNLFPIFVAQLVFSFCFYFIILVVTEDWIQECQRSC